MGAMDDLRNQIKFRGLKASGNQDPVSEFKGLFIGFDIEEQEYQGQKSGRNNVVLHFTDLDKDSIKSDVPYPYPTKDVTIGYSDRQQSRWGVFAESGLKFLAENEDFSNLIGRRVYLKTVVRKLYQGKEKGEVDTNCWSIADVEGASSNGAAKASGISIETTLLLLLNGKTQQAFNMEVLKMPAVQKNSGLLSSILNNTWFKELEAKGHASKDEAGVYTVAPEALVV